MPVHPQNTPFHNNGYWNHRLETRTFLRLDRHHFSGSFLTKSNANLHFCPVSVADPGCLSRILDPDFYPSRVPDLGSKNRNKREGWKKTSCHTFFCSHKFHKIENYFIFEMLKKKIWAIFRRIIELFTQKIVTKLSKIGGWDSGSEIRKKPIPDPGSGSATLLLPSHKERILRT